MPGHPDHRLPSVGSCDSRRFPSRIVPAGGVAEWQAMIVFTLASVCVYFSFHISAATCPDSMRRFLRIYETGAPALAFRLIDPLLRATLDEESPYLVEP